MESLRDSVLGTGFSGLGSRDSVLETENFKQMITLTKQTFWLADSCKA